MNKSSNERHPQDFAVYRSLGGDSMLHVESHTTAEKAMHDARERAHVDRGVAYLADVGDGVLVRYRADTQSGRVRVSYIERRYQGGSMTQENGKTFGEWAKWHALVDAAVQARAGVSLADLPDVPLRDWYDAGVLPHVAAEDALRAGGWGEGDEDETFDERVRG